MHVSEKTASTVFVVGFGPGFIGTGRRGRARTRPCYSHHPFRRPARTTGVDEIVEIEPAQTYIRVLSNADRHETSIFRSEG